MKNILCVLILLMSVNSFAQSSKKVELNDTTIKKRIIRYDHSVLRIPGKSLPVGILTVFKNGEIVKTKGFLKGKGRWNKYKLEVEGGNYFNGKINIKGTNAYKKSDSITVNVYTRKWFLGRKDKFLFTQKIPYDYETGIHFLTQGNFSKSPGGHIPFGIRTYFDNKMFVDKWASSSGKNLTDFSLTPDGAHISKSKGDLKIYNDPYKIINDKVKLVAALAKFPAITDTLQIMLNYINNYECKIESNTVGHDLNVKVNVYSDPIINEKLMSVQVTDNSTKKLYNYLINVNGGSVAISSKGANGIWGNNGWDGSSGMDGSSGSETTEFNTETESDGTTTTTSTTVEGPGGDGSNGGDGGNGEDGGNGSDGGNITINYTPSAQPYLNMIKAISIPGYGGAGGAAGQGGRGGSGGSGSPSGSSGMDGRDGFAGSDGASGKAGKVVFIPLPIH